MPATPDINPAYVQSRHERTRPLKYQRPVGRETKRDLYRVRSHLVFYTPYMLNWRKICKYHSIESKSQERKILLA